MVPSDVSRFYVRNDDRDDARKCEDSRDSRLPIMITALTLDGSIKAFTGIVQLVEHDSWRPLGMRWRITMSELDQTQALARRAGDAPAAVPLRSHFSIS
jgi:hypothetical protein